MKHLPLIILAVLFYLIGTTATIAQSCPQGGEVWTLRTAAELNAWGGLTYGNGLFVAVSGGGTNRVMTSPDGNTWTSRAVTEASTWRSVAYGNGTFVAVASTGTNRLISSTDGINWTIRTPAQVNAWRSVTYGNNMFVAVAANGTNQVMTSPDGINWTARSSPLNIWLSVTYGNGLFVAVSNTSPNNIMTSTDGITWSSYTSPQPNFWRCVTYGNGTFVAVSSDGTNRVMTSTNGSTWTARTAVSSDWFAVTYGAGSFVAVADVGTNRVMTSPDGITWTPRTAAAQEQWYAVTYGNNTFVAAGNSGSNRVMTSTANNSVTPTVSITAAPGNTINSGTNVTFTATPVNGGSSPTYQWKVNGGNVGTNSNVYANASLANNNIVTCEMTSSDVCANPTNATSNGITMIVTSCPNTLYVDNTATGANDGSDWTNAFTDFNEALDLAHQCSNITTINVAGGSSSTPVIYKPTHKPYNVSGVETTTADARDVTFQVRSGLAIYGGFPAGGGTRDPKTNIVILSGDINNDNSFNGNSYHTVLFVNPTVNSILDGFIIEGGSANGTGTTTAYTVAVPQNKGGGVYCEGGSGGYIQNCEVRNNYALSRGAGMFMTNNSDLSLEFMNIRNNVTVPAYGGGIAAINCTLHLLTSLVHNNSANSGGGIFMENNVVIDIKNSVITANGVTGAGGAGVGSWNNSNTLNIINTIVFQNSGTAVDIQGSETLNVTYSDIEGWVSGGTGVIDADPLFLDSANPAGANGVYGDGDDGFSLDSGSPCAGTGGTPTFPWSLNDFAGGAWGGTYDMGAYKKQFSCPPSGTTILYVSAAASSNGNGLSNTSPMQTLGEALDMAWKCPDVTEIRVAAGDYYPTHKPYNMGVNRIGTEITTSDDRDKTFHIRTGLLVKGGYDPTFATQDISLYTSSLSGDIGTTLDPADNTYHVVVIDSSANWASNVGTTILSHLYITQGNADNDLTTLSINGHLVSAAQGAGIYTTSGTNELYQLSIMANTAVVAAGCYIEGGNIRFYTNSIEFNTSTDIAGGAYFSQTNISDFASNAFTYNTAGTLGGGLYLYLCNNAIIDNNIAANNTANDGAGIYIKECNDVSITNSLFNSNTVINAGSAMYFLDANDAVLSNNIINLNTVNSSINDGGAITFSNTTATMNYNSFDNNTSGAFGGAIYLNSGSAVTVSADAYYNNTAINGGAIAVNNSQLNLENCDIITNVADRGAIYANLATTSIKKVVFSGNFNAMFDGGAIYSESSTDSIINCIFYGNDAGSGKGGAIYNSFSNEFLANNTFSNNNAFSNGGALYNEFSGTENYLAINNLFYDNTIDYDSTAAGADIAYTGTTNLGVFKNNLMQFGSGAYTGASALAAGSINNVYNPTAISPFLDASDPDGLNDYWRDGDDGLQLGAGSLAMNVGTNTDAPSSDIAGTTRPLFSIVDIGAYESNINISITSFSPTSACAGNNTIIITGAGFTGVTSVSIGGAAVGSFNVDSDAQITAIIGNSVTGVVSVATPSGGAISGDIFTVNPNVGTPSFTGGAINLCSNATSTYVATATNASSVTYSIVGAGATINPTTGVVSAITGNFTVRATATGTCGANTTADRAVIVPPIVTAPVFTVAPSPICSGVAETYTATATNATSIVYSTLSNNINPTTGVMSGSTGSFTVKATATDVCGISKATSFPVVVNKSPTLTITNPAAVTATTVNITLKPGVIAGLYLGTLSYWTDAAASIQLPNPTAVGTAGTYYIKADNGNCARIRPVVVTINTIRIKMSDDNTALIYPNPAENQLNVAASFPANSHIRIYDVQGKMVLNETLSADNENVFSLETMGEGLYIVNIYDENGNVLHTDKVVKQ